MAKKTRMTAAQWAACEEPTEMLAYLRGKASERKQRLLACACCRTMGGLLQDARVLRALEVAERHADEPNPDELKAALQEAGKAQRSQRRNSLLAAYAAVMTVAEPRCEAPLDEIAEALVLAATPRIDPSEHRAAVAARRALLAGPVRDLFCHPLRLVLFDPTLRTPAVLTLARAAYDQRTLPGGTLDPARLAALADALEEAGRAHADLLSHLRSPGPHYLGCWPLDLVLGKS